MNIETTPLSIKQDEHVALCKKLKAGKISSTEVVAALRRSVEGDGWAAQSEEVKELSTQERKVFKDKAAAAIDRILPSSKEGTLASRLKNNKGLLSFISVVTPNIRLLSLIHI